MGERRQPIETISEQETTVAYEPPCLFEIGTVHDLTLARGQRCFWGKKWGGSDGLEFMGITVPVSSC